MPEMASRWYSPTSARSSPALAGMPERSPVKMAVKNGAAVPSNSVSMRFAMARAVRWGR